MPNKKDKPLLLLDNSNMISLINEGEYKCQNLSFEEAKAIVELHDAADVLLGFSDHAIETVIFNYLGIADRNYQRKHIRNMRPGQDAVVFKLYVTSSETQPVITADDGVEAKKIQNVYVYCQYLMRVT
jgi:hypothetical protein